MPKIDQQIIDFINEHHLLTLATSNNNLPYCASCFYVFSEENNSLIFSSAKSTKHVRDFLKNPYVAGAIALETKTIRKIQGIQFLGKITELKGKDFKKASKQYLQAFPYARFMETILWSFNLNFVKMTHNRLGFGKKLICEE